MLFTVDLLVPKATPADNPAIVELRLVSGNVTEVGCVFPPGPASLVHVTVSDSAHQIVPGNPEEDINEDWATVPSRMRYPLQSPYTLIFKGWSPLARYDHTITFNVDLEPAGGEDSLDLLVKLLGAGSAVMKGR